MKRIIGINGAKLAAAPRTQLLPGWEAGEEWEVVLRRPSMYELMSRGMVPNPLLPVVEAMFIGALPKRTDGSEAEVLKIIARAALVSPTMAELEAEDVWLTDNQLAGIYAYALGGPMQLAEFRAAINTAAIADEPAVADAAGGAFADRGSADGVVPE